MSDLRERGSPTRPLGSGTVSLANLVEELRYAIGQRRARLLFEPDPPRVMVEQFELLRFIDQGGMGGVFEALDIKLDRRVALKVCRSGDAPALRHEAQCLAKLAHPNVVAVHDVLDWQGHVVLVMELVEGMTLHAWLCEASPPWHTIVFCYLDAGRGLAAAHEAGIEHGDFKPGNVLVDVTGRVRVADFGLARFVAHDEETDDAIVVPNMGTKVYMPPERLQGKSAGVRSDVYSFCASVWESLYRVRPFPGRTTHALIDAITTRPPDRGQALRGTPEAIRAVLARGLSPDPSARQVDMPTLLAELERASEAPERRRAWWLRVLGVGAFGVVLAGTVLGTAAWVRSQTPDRDPAQNPAPPPATKEAHPIEQTLALAREAADRGKIDIARQHLQTASLEARLDHDESALRRVAEQAESLGDALDRRGDFEGAQDCWYLASEVLRDLPEALTAKDRLRRKLTKIQNK